MNKVNQKQLWAIFFFHITRVLGYYVPPGYKMVQHIISFYSLDTGPYTQHSMEVATA